MIRAIAQQAEAERARRAKIINAEAEMQAAQMLADAAKILASEEQALQLRYLQTLKEIARTKKPIRSYSHCPSNSWNRY